MANAVLIDVAAYGAVGDGSTDDTTAFNLARAAARDAGAALALRPGTYIVGKLTVSSSERWLAPAGMTTLKRLSTATVGAFVTVTAGTFHATGIIFDGNQSNAAGCHDVFVNDGCTESRFVDCRFINAQTNAGWGAGLLVSTGTSVDQVHVIDRCEAYDNDAQGILVNDCRNLTIRDSVVRDNGDDGISLNNFDLTFTQQIRDTVVRDCQVYGNAGTGIVVGNFVSDNIIATSARLYNHDHPEALDVLVTGCQVHDNAEYGIAMSGQDSAVRDCQVYENGTAGGIFGGVLLNGNGVEVTGCTIRDNRAYGIDAGGAVGALIANNVIRDNASGDGDNETPGLLIEAAVDVTVVGNHLVDNGSSAGTNLLVNRCGGDGNGNNFPTLARYVSIRSNYFTCSGTRKGISIVDGCDDIAVLNNDFNVQTAHVAIRAVADDVVIAGNRVQGSFDLVNGSTLNGSGLLYIPDVLDDAYYAATTNAIEGIRYYTAVAVVGVSGIGWIDVTAGGSGYTSAPTVTISDSGVGGNATADAFVHNGSVVGVRVTARGGGYTANTVSVSFSGGGGSGATATAQVSVPVPIGRRLLLHLHLGNTVKRSGTQGPIVDSPSGADLTVPAAGFLELRGVFSRWQVSGKNF